MYEQTRQDDNDDKKKKFSLAYFLLIFQQKAVGWRERKKEHIKQTIKIITFQLLKIFSVQIH